MNRLLLRGATILGCGLVLAAATTADAAKPARLKPDCAATRRVVNHGMPAPWAQKIFSVLRSRKHSEPLPERMLSGACGPGPYNGEAIPGELDYHRTWKIRDPINPHGPWVRIVPGRTGIMYDLGGGGGFPDRCALEQQRAIMWFGFPYPIDVITKFWGLVIDGVVKVTATGGTGTRKGPNGKLLPQDVSSKPKHNVYHLVAPNGVAKLTFVRRNAPPIVIDMLAPPPPLVCPTPAEGAAPTPAPSPNPTPPATTRVIMDPRL